MMAVLILNPDCSISAIAPVEYYFHYEYRVKGCVCFAVEMSQEDFELAQKTMWDLRQNVYVILSPSQAKLLPVDATYFVCHLPCEGVPVLDLPF